MKDPSVPRLNSYMIYDVSKVILENYQNFLKKNRDLILMYVIVKEAKSFKNQIVPYIILKRKRHTLPYNSKLHHLNEHYKFFLLSSGKYYHLESLMMSVSSPKYYDGVCQFNKPLNFEFNEIQEYKNHFIIQFCLNIISSLTSKTSQFPKKGRYP